MRSECRSSRGGGNLGGKNERDEGCRKGGERVYFRLGHSGEGVFGHHLPTGKEVCFPPRNEGFLESNSRGEGPLAEQRGGAVVGVCLNFIDNAKVGEMSH